MRIVAQSLIEESAMAKQDRRIGTDRRSGIERRQTRPLRLENTYFLERRQPPADRRTGIEPRTGWTRINKWSSAYIGIAAVAVASAQSPRFKK